MPSIFELRQIPQADLYGKAQATIARFPSLRSIYSAEFLDDLTRRATSVNYLLWLLVQDPHDEYTAKFWNEILSNLDLLGARAWQRFEGRLRCKTSAEIETARVELDMMTRFVRAGVHIDFPPEDGLRHYEFAAETAPRTFWEVKTVLDIDRVRLSSEVLHRFQDRLQTLKHPFMISVEDVTVEEDINIDVTMKQIRQRIASLHRNGARAPYRFEISGVQVSVKGRNSPGEGYIGTMEHGFLFEDEGAERINEKICSAVPQLPRDEAGVVVIDASESEWLNIGDLHDACFGTSNQYELVNGAWARVSNGDGVFSRQRNRRISAVAYYNRRFSNSKRYPRFDIIFNPFARIPLAPETLAMIGARQFAMLPSGKGTRRLTNLAGNGDGGDNQY